MCLAEGTVAEVRGGQELLQEWRRLVPTGVELPAVFELAGALEKRGFALPADTTPDELEEDIVQEWRRRHHDR